MDPIPTLYSFRRCPYAIRARMAVAVAGIEVNVHEVALKNKPASMLQASSKGTVPVLCVAEKVIDESLDIMRWALLINDPDGWCTQASDEERRFVEQLIHENDGDFKRGLDRYKYASRYPEFPPEYYRNQCENFLDKLENILQHNTFLLGTQVRFVDIAIFPFVRQFSMVDNKWFNESEYRKVGAWLRYFLDLPLVAKVMEKLE